jgi:hypothetical protein
MSTAAIALPSTNAGMIIAARFALRSSNGLTYPDAGNHPSCTANNRISRMPSQKFGVDRPHRAKMLAA